MATATPSSRCGASAGCAAASCWKSVFTDVAEIWTSATPPVSCARLPISTTRAMRSVSALGSGLVEALVPERLQHLGRRHRQLGEPDAGGGLHGVGDGPERRHDRRLPDAAHAVGVL